MTTDLITEFAFHHELSVRRTYVDYTNIIITIVIKCNYLNYSYEI